MGLGRIGEALLTPPAAALALAPLPNPAVRSGSRLGGAALLQAAPVESQTALQMAWGSWALSLAELSWAGQPGFIQEACSGQAGQSSQRESGRRPQTRV